MSPAFAPDQSLKEEDDQISDAGQAGMEHAERMLRIEVEAREATRQLFVRYLCTSALFVFGVWELVIRALFVLLVFTLLIVSLIGIGVFIYDYNAFMKRFTIWLTPFGFELAERMMKS
jgi:hypothetical protein